MKRRGSGPKPATTLDKREIVYAAIHWALLESLRKKAQWVLSTLGPWKEAAFVHGSVARGDVDARSDVDIIIPIEVSSQVLETHLEIGGVRIYSKELAQPTPMHSPKAHLYLDLQQTLAVTLPLSPFRTLESEFYKFGGTVTIHDLEQDIRKPGCTKKLTLVEPTPTGHAESLVPGNEAEVARKLGISTDIVRERIRVLTRRDSIGRTGMFLKKTIPEGVSFEQALRDEAMANPALRRTLRERATHR